MSMMYNTDRTDDMNAGFNSSSIPLAYGSNGEMEVINESQAIASSHLVELSDIQQEQVSGGCSCTAGGGGGGFDFLFFQDTTIDTFGENQTQISNGETGLSGASSTRSGYRFRQTTLAIGGFGSGNGNSLASLFSFFKGLLG